MHEVDEIERVRLLAESTKVFIESRFNFLKAIYGLRPACFHLLISTSGAGKSTLNRSILRECLAKHRVMLWLSEESIKDINLVIARGVFTPMMLKNLSVFSEQDGDYKNMEAQELFDALCAKVEETKPHILLLDNLSTSSFYMGQRIQMQNKVAKKLKELALRTKAAILCIAHTAAHVSEYNQSLISETDIRDSKTVTNLAEFMFALQRIRVGDESYSFIRILKSRHTAVTNAFYQLEFNPKTFLVEKDEPVSWADFNSAYKSRNVLGGKK